jgi:hypothetical protein
MLQDAVAGDTCQEKEDWLKRAIFLATAALLAMLILMPMAVGQGPGNTTLVTTYQGPSAGGILVTTGAGPSAPGIPESGGPAILLPAAVLLLGSGILSYAILRRRS